MDPFSVHPETSIDGGESKLFPACSWERCNIHLLDSGMRTGLDDTGDLEGMAWSQEGCHDCRTVLGLSNPTPGMGLLDLDAPGGTP